MTSIPAPPRTTYLLGCTTAVVTARLDYKSRLALSWIDKWIADNGGLKAPHSGLIRRAVLRYVQYLQAMETTQAAAEVREVRYACRGSNTSNEDKDAAQARLGASKGGPLPPLSVILEGQHVVDALKALTAHMEQFNDIPDQKKPTT